MAENANRYRGTPKIVSIFIDKDTSSEEETNTRIRSGTPIPQKNILAYDDAQLEIVDSDGTCSGNVSCDEDTQSRSSSTDLNNFLQIKQVKKCESRIINRLC